MFTKNGKLRTNADADADAVEDLTPTGDISTNDDFLDDNSYITEWDMAVAESKRLSAQFEEYPPNSNGYKPMLNNLGSKAENLT